MRPRVKLGRWNWVARWVLGCVVVACAGLWTVSLRGDVLARLTPWSDFQVRNGGVWGWFKTRYDFVHVKHDGIWCHHLPGYEVVHATWWPIAADAPWLWGSLEWGPVFPHDANGRMELFVPLWMPFAVCGVISVLAWRKQITRFRAGACMKCGYDLAGLSEGAVCPECGARKIE